MDFRNSFFFKIYTVLAVSSFCYVNPSRMSCPQRLQIEKGENMTVSCNPEDIQLSSSFWYKGDPSVSGPVLRLERGVPGGTEYGKRHYDITSTGAMIIIDATVDHEGIYSFLAYFDDGQFEKLNVTLVVTITPLQACPVIDKCDPCKDCKKKVNGTDSLRCTVSHSRPKMTLNWLLISANGIKIFRPSKTEEKDYSTDSWNTSSVLPYVARSCNQQAVLQCVAQDEMRLLKHWHSSVNIYTDTCTAGIADIENGTQTLFLAVGLSVSLLVPFIVFFVCLIKKIRRNKQTSNSLSNEAKQLLVHLKESYRSQCSLGDSLHVDRKFQVTYTDKSTSTISTKELLTDGKIRNFNRVILTGEIGISTLAIQLLEQWLIQEEHDYILAFIPLKGMHREMRVADILKQTLSTESKLTSQQINEIIKHSSCLLLLDCVHHIMFDKVGAGGFLKLAGANSARNSDYMLTISDVLNGTINKTSDNGKVTIWATSLYKNEAKRVFQSPTAHANVVESFEQQVQYYIKESYSFLSASQGKAIEVYANHSFQNRDKQICIDTEERKTAVTNLLKGEKENKGELEMVDKSSLQCEKSPLIPSSEQNQQREMDYSADKSAKNCSQVYAFLHTNDILQDFKKTPHLLEIIICITTERLMNKNHQKASKTNISVAEAIRSLIKELLANYQENINTPVLDQVSNLEDKLGEMALNVAFNSGKLNLNKVSTEDKQWVDNALAIGILLETRNGDCKSKTQKNIFSSSSTKIMFSHHYIQGYLLAATIARNPDKLNSFLTLLRGDNRPFAVGVFRFATLFEEPVFDKLCKILLELKLHNYLIDILYERPDKIEAVAKTFEGNTMAISLLSSKHFEEAIKLFCEKCQEIQVKLHTAIFRGEGNPFASFMQDVILPEIAEIHFFQMTFNETEFVSCLCWLHTMNVTRTICFEECKTPDILSLDSRKKLKHTAGSRLKDLLSVRRRVEQGTSKVLSLNYDTGEWKK